MADDRGTDYAREAVAILNARKRLNALHGIMQSVGFGPDEPGTMDGMIADRLKEARTLLASRLRGLG